MPTARQFFGAGASQRGVHTSLVSHSIKWLTKDVCEPFYGMAHTRPFHKCGMDVVDMWKCQLSVAARFKTGHSGNTPFSSD